MLQSRFSIGIACSRSSAFPCGTPSTTSSNTTSASSLAAIQCPAVAPTFPEPTTVTFFRLASPFLCCHSQRFFCHSAALFFGHSAAQRRSLVLTTPSQPHHH